MKCNKQECRFYNPESGDHCVRSPSQEKDCMMGIQNYFSLKPGILFERKDAMLRKG